MGLFDYRMEGTQPQGMLQDLLKRYKAGVTERVGLLKQDPVGYLSQAAMEGLPPMPDIGQNPDGTIRRNPNDPATKWLADNVGFGALTVYHGSPYRFDKFDMSKIGHGEGAQAYGHGLYVAESPTVAKSYSDLAASGPAPSPIRMFQGQELVPGTPQYHAGTLLERTSLPAARKQVASWIASGSPDPKVLEGWKETLATLEKAGKKSDFKVMKGGNMYKADIPDDQIGKMLDWDKPLSEQSWFPKGSKEEIIAKVKAEGRKPTLAEIAAVNVKGNTHYGDPSGKVFYDRMVTKLGSPEAASKALADEGLVGLKYFDGNSRGAAEGTRNYVLFNDQLPRILERNGVPTGAQPWQPGEYELLRHAPK